MGIKDDRPSRSGAGPRPDREETRMFGRRKKQKRAFQPALDQGVSLESRCLLSVAGRNLIPPPAVRQNFVLPQTKSPLATGGLPTHTENYVQTGVGSGGRVAVLVDTDGEIYAVHVTGGGSVRAKAVAGGRVDVHAVFVKPDAPVLDDVAEAHLFGLVAQLARLDEQRCDACRGRDVGHVV